MLAYLAKEGDPEVGAKVPLPCSHNVYHLPEGSVQLAIHLCHVPWRGRKREKGGRREGEKGEGRRGEGGKVGKEKRRERRGGEGERIWRSGGESRVIRKQI